MFQNIQLALKYFSGRMASAGTRNTFQWVVGFIAGVVGSKASDPQFIGQLQSIYDATAALAATLNTLVGQLAVLAGAVTAAYSMFKASSVSQAAGLASQGMTVQAPDDVAKAVASPAVMPASATTVVTAPQIAKAMNDPEKVLSSADVEVVSK